MFTKIRALTGFAGEAALYRAEPPVKDYAGNGHEFVIVSAVRAPFSGPEVMMFPSNEAGEVVSWSDIRARRGTLQHAAVLY